MASQQSQTLLTLNSSAVSDLKEGINFLRNKEDGKNYIIYKSMDVMRACKNQCKHQGGLFVKDIEDLDESTVRCTKHNWKLNVSTMKYVNPPDCFQQDELVLEPDENGGLLLLELNPPDPWQADPRTPEELEPGEVLKWKADFIKTERKKLLNYKSQLVKDLQPKVYCPFAGYFVEAHPSDSYIKETNLKNNPEELNKLITKTSFVSTWTPKSGAVLDMARILKDPLDSEAIIDPPAGTKLYKDNWEFDVYLNEINTAISNEIFQHKDWINFYYNWAGFRDYNLVIRMIETNDDFSPLHSGFDYLVDFLDLSFPNERPARDHFYLEIKNRVGVMRQTVIKGLLWNDLYIGFQNRLFRDPDIYHHQ
ncbi:UNVERIFIED_CONTAM: hypothetical protein FKN15_064087 [Acipenser sinensis]